jgi:hypothetical protein
MHRPDLGSILLRESHLKLVLAYEIACLGLAGVADYPTEIRQLTLRGQAGVYE